MTQATGKKAREEEELVQSSPSLNQNHDCSGHGLNSGSSKSSCFDELSGIFLGTVFDQFDQGSNFTLGLFQQVVYQLRFCRTLK